MARDVDFFNYIEPPERAHLFDYLERGYGWLAGKVSCSKGTNYGERWSPGELSIEQEDAFEVELSNAHAQLFGCSDVVPWPAEEEVPV